MKVKAILNKFLLNVTPSMHISRRNSVFACVYSLVNGASATVTSMGRGIESNAFEKNNIKRACRLLSNSHLSAEQIHIYKTLAKSVIQSNSQPIVHVDWSDLDDSKTNFLIRASIAMQGRSVTIYEEVHGISTKEKPTTHIVFLSRLKHIIGERCTPIIVSDAGFKVPWFKSVLNQGWHFVGRARLPNFYSMDGERWQSITQLYEKATCRPKMFNGHIARSNPLPVTMVLYKQKHKGRKDLNRDGVSRKSSTSKKYGRSANDPWLLVSSLPNTPSLKKEVVNIYKTRMQIEEGFRDTKSQRYGLGMQLHLSYKTKRLANLILLTYPSGQPHLAVRV